MPAEANLSERRTYDVVVVGAGAIGLCCAWRAPQRGASVVVLDEGVEVRGGVEVVEALLDGSRLTGVCTDVGEELAAGTVVLATGAWSGTASWLPEAGGPPVRPVKGQILELRGPDGEAPCERIVASERVYLVPRPDGRMIVGATTEEHGFDTPVTAGGVPGPRREALALPPGAGPVGRCEAGAG